LSLQLLSRLCDLSNGHKQVSDALSMLRLRFGEPVRFKFLVGMLNSYNSDIFQVGSTFLDLWGVNVIIFKRIFAESTGEKNGDFELKFKLKKCSIGFEEKSQFLRRPCPVTVH
jgi:hypothetical protein